MNVEDLLRKTGYSSVECPFCHRTRPNHSSECSVHLRHKDSEQNYFGTYGKPHLRDLGEENPAAAFESQPRFNSNWSARQPVENSYNDLLDSVKKHGWSRSRSDTQFV